MTIKLSNVFAGISVPQIGVRPAREVRPLRLAGRIVANRAKNFAVNIARGENIQHLMNASDGGGTAGDGRNIGRHLVCDASPANRQ